MLIIMVHYVRNIIIINLVFADVGSERVGEVNGNISVLFRRCQ